MEEISWNPISQTSVSYEVSVLILGLSALLVMNTHQIVVVSNDNDCRIRILGIPSEISNGLNERCAFLNNI